MNNPFRIGDQVKYLEMSFNVTKIEGIWVYISNALNVKDRRCVDYRKLTFQECLNHGKITG